MGKKGNGSGRNGKDDPVGKWNTKKLIKNLSESMNRFGSRLRGSNTFVPTWDGVRDIRDHFEDVDFAIRCNGTLEHEQVAYLESTLNSSYRKLISIQVLPGYIRETVKASGGDMEESDVPDPDYATMKNLLLKYILPANEAEISYKMLTSEEAHMKYNENFVRFIVRFNTLVCRCDQARGSTLGPLTKHEKLTILGTLLLPRLRLKWSEQFLKVNTFEEMITKLKSYEDICDRSMNASCAAGSDPHRPATSLSSATITGKPSQQLHRSSSTNETVKYWNTGPSGQGFMMGEATLGLPSSAAFNPNVPSTDTSAGVPAHLKRDWEAFLALKSGQDRPGPTEHHVTAEALLKAKTGGTGSHVAFIATSNTGGVDQDRCPYEDCAVKPHWSLGFDTLPLAVAKAANDGEGFAPFCLWCRTDKHAGAHCPKVCSRCGGGHRRRDCTVRHSDVQCQYGHKGHTDKTCFMQICGIENPRLAGRKIIRLDPRQRTNPSPHHAKVSFAREAKDTTLTPEAKYGPSLRIARSVEELRQSQIADQQFNAKFHENSLASSRLQIERMEKLQARVEDVLSKEKDQSGSASLHALMAEHAKKQENAVSSLIKQHKKQAADLHNRIKQSNSRLRQKQKRGRGRSRSRSPERRREYVDRNGNYIDRNGEYIHSRDRKRSSDRRYGGRR